MPDSARDPRGKKSEVISRPSGIGQDLTAIISLITLPPPLCASCLLHRCARSLSLCYPNVSRCLSSMVDWQIRRRLGNPPPEDRNYEYDYSKCACVRPTAGHFGVCMCVCVCALSPPLGNHPNGGWVGLLVERRVCLDKGPTTPVPLPVPVAGRRGTVAIGEIGLSSLSTACLSDE
jgi:hypothetical protein